MVHDFLFELGCEELPSAAVWSLADEFAHLLLAALDKSQLAYGPVRRFATPRRFALSIEALEAQQSSQRQTRRGPAALAAYDAQGQPTPALLGFAQSCGVPLDQLSRMKTDKGDWIVCETQSRGIKTQDLLPTLVSQSLSALSIVKPMRWGESEALFVRPVHWAVMIYGEEVIEHDFFGVRSGNRSRGHRFHHPQELTLTSAAQYEAQMNAAFVVADFALRRELIRDQVQKLAEQYNAQPVVPDSLLQEVTSIVEWPHALMVHFEPEFLKVPAEVLIASMQSHQKCFALKDQQGKLIPCCITVSNINSSKPEQVVSGNEKVMRARLADAVFFFNQDQKQTLSHYLPRTEQVIFQTQLGTLADKTRRIQALMEHWVSALHLNPKQVQRAALLSKCDLMTGMVGEFPELQGLMGYYYALHDAEDKEVAEALKEQYMPRFAADELPTSDLGLALSLADRMDTLVGAFGLGLKPSGVKDPFKLRRHALAVVRLLIATAAPLNLDGLIAEAKSNFSFDRVQEGALIAELKPFILERLQSYYQAQGIALGLIQAARACQDEWLYDLDRRIRALEHFVLMPESAALSAACKRVSNLLNQTAVSWTDAQLDERLLEPGAERALYDRMQELRKSLAPLYASGDYAALLRQLASLKNPVDSFFDAVMVLVDEEAVKRNRLLLLRQLQELLQGVADIAQI